MVNYTTSYICHRREGSRQYNKHILRVFHHKFISCTLIASGCYRCAILLSLNYLLGLLTTRVYASFHLSHLLWDYPSGSIHILKASSASSRLFSLDTMSDPMSMVTNDFKHKMITIKEEVLPNGVITTLLTPHGSHQSRHVKM